MSKKPEGQQISKEVRIPLTIKDYAEKGQAMSELDSEILILEDEQKQSNAQFKTKIGERETERRRLSQIVRDKHETKVLDVVMTKNFEQNLVQFWLGDDKDDWTTVEERAMTEEERQLEMDGITPRGARPLPKRKVKDRKKAAAGDKDDEEDEVATTIRQETSRRTKRSAVDGATA